MDRNKILDGPTTKENLISYLTYIVRVMIVLTLCLWEVMLVTRLVVHSVPLCDLLKIVPVI